jgi:hypothetical protein
MGAIFQSLGRTIAAGVVVLVVLLIILVAAGGKVALGEHGWWLFAMRWLHVTAGVMWIGLLWYFNFVQTPSMPKIPDDQKPAISKVIAPTALFWFRWAAMATIILGLLLALMNNYLVQALTLQKPFTSIGLGAVARHDHVVQRLVHHLAEPEEGARHRAGGPRRESGCRQARRHGLAHQHHAVDPDALLHGGAEPRRRGLLARPSDAAYLAPGMPPRRLPGFTPRALNQPRFISSA